MNLDHLTQPAMAILAIVGATIGAGLLLANQKEAKLDRYLPYFISIGTGMFIALCFVEFIPHAMASGGSYAPLLILAGILLVVFAEKHIAPRLSPAGHQCRSQGSTAKGCISHNAACTSIGCLLVCAFFDGVELAAGFEIGKKTGYLMSTGMLFHTVPEGALAASIGLAGGFSKSRARTTVLLVGAAILMGSVFSLAASHLLGFQDIVLPITAGVLLYVSLGHLLPFTIKSKWGLTGTAVGMAAFLLLSLGHHHDHHHGDHHDVSGKGDHHGDKHAGE